MKLSKILFSIFVGLGLTTHLVPTYAQRLTIYNDIANYIKSVAPEAENEYFVCWYFTGDPNKICATEDRFQGKNIPNPYYCPVNYATGGGYRSYLDCWVVTMEPAVPLEVKDMNCTPDPDHPTTTVHCSGPYIPSAAMSRSHK